MSTILFDHIVFGPIKSRRLGNSLGINLLPKHGKWCSFDCIYCECGWNKDGKKDNILPTADQVKEALKTKLETSIKEKIPIDTITFSGNGEPTMNPDFPKIIDITLRLRDELYPKAKVSVLTNSSQINKKEVREALMRIDNPILKIDSAIEEYVKIINRPNAAYSLTQTIENIKLFHSDFILQTMFLKGGDNINIDCTNPEHCEAWRNLVREIKPREIMMYTIDRETPAKNLQKVTIQEMEKIAEPLIKEGFFVQIRG
jgi:Fe-S oxidoreductases